MPPCYAITAVIWAFFRIGKVPECVAIPKWCIFCNFCKAVFNCENFIVALFCLRGGSILPQTHQHKEETGCVFFSGYCFPSFCPTARMAITADFLPSTEPGSTVGALTLQYPEGERQELSNLTPLSLLPRGVLLQLLAHRALAAHSC